MPDQPILLPALDTEPDEWGPDHDEVVECLSDEELADLIKMGDRQGRFINVNDDTDNGLDIDEPDIR